MSDKTDNTQETKKVHRGVLYRLCPGTRSKAKKLSGIAGACRFVWNAILAEVQADYKEAVERDGQKPSVSFFSLGKRFTGLRQTVDWLPEYSFKIVRYTLKDQADAWQGLFRRGHGVPKFKSKYKTTPSFTIPESVKIEDGKLYIPKVGWVTLRRRGGPPYPTGIPKQVTVKKDGRYWTASVLYEIDEPEYTTNGGTAGIDANTYNVAVTLSTGERELLHVPSEKDESIIRREIRIKRYQRKLARQQKGSNRSKVTKRKIAKHQRVRINACHQNSRILANKAETFVREDLKVTNLVRSAKGTVESPGKNVNAKSGLNRVMLNSSTGRLFQYCEYKFANVRVVNPAYTSQTCSNCGCVDKRNRVSQSKFVCVSCGYADHADLNASVNILALGIGATGRGGAFALATPMSRQIDTAITNA